MSFLEYLDHDCEIEISEMVMEIGLNAAEFVREGQGRRAVGFELKETYYGQALRNVEKWRREVLTNEGDLFAGVRE